MNVLCEGTKHVVRAYFIILQAYYILVPKVCWENPDFFFKSGKKNISHFTWRCMFCIVDRNI